MKRLAAVLLSLRALVIAAFAGSVGHGQEVANPDDAAWAAAAEAGTAEACQRYLEEFPAGRHAEEAFRCLVESRLEPGAGPAPDLDLY